MKKILVLFLSLVLLLAAMPNVSVYAAKAPAFVIDTAKGDAGDTVNITVSTKNNSGIISMKLLLKYDSTALKLVEVKEGKFKGIAFSPENSNPFVMNWIDAIHPNNKTNGTVATLTFKILDTAPNGKSEISLTYDPEDVFDIDFNNVTFDVQNGYVEITNSNADKQPSSKPIQTESDGTASSDVSSDTMNDTTTSTILQQIYDGANSNDEDLKNQSTDDSASNDWILWVVIAAIVVLFGAFTVVIIKNKKNKK